MINFDITLTRRRVLASILVIGLATAAAGVGTFALFTDSASTEGNTITAGDMQLTVNEGFSFSNDIYPGQETGDKTITLDYTAGVDATLDVTDATVSTESNADWSGKLNVVSASISDGDETHTYSDPSNIGDLTTTGGIVTLSGGDTVTLTANFELDSDAGNDFTDTTADVTVTFEAEQVGSS